MTTLDSIGYIESGEHWPELVMEVCTTLKPKSVLDLGCGPCRSLATFKEFGVERIVGLDGAKALLTNPFAAPHRQNIMLVNLEGSPCVFGERFDLVWSYEVAEHVQNEEHFLVTLTENAARWIVMTAAQPGQGGTGHVNCQPREHWIKQLDNRGFTYREDVTERFRALGRAKTGYYDGNGMVFERRNVEFGTVLVQLLNNAKDTMDRMTANAILNARPAPIDIRIGAHYVCHKKKRATYEALKAFRQHYPDAPIHLVSDNGDDFSDLAEHFNCDYTHYTEGAGNGITTAFDTNRQAMMWFRRLEDTCKMFAVNWIVILEDDVLTRDRIAFWPPAPMAGPCTMPFTEAAQFAIRQRHPNLSIHGYSGCGGTIFQRDIFLSCMNHFYDIDQVALLDARLKRHSDAMLTFLFLWNGAGNAPWLDHSERSRGVGREDAAFDHQYKYWYDKPWEENLLGQKKTDPTDQ